MSNRTLVAMTFAVLLGMAVLLFLNVASHLNGNKNLLSSYIRISDVKGIAIEHNGKLHTLNFSQQAHVVEYLNTAVAVNKQDYPKISPDLPVTKIIIYRFSGTDLVITPIAFKELNMVFSAPEWDSSAYLMELSGGELLTVFKNSYDR